VAIADARPGSRYAEGHVAGALHLPCSARSSDAAESLSHLVGIRSLVVYGDSTAEALAVAESVRRRAPHLEVRVLDGGFSAWSQAGLACASGPCDQCEEPHGP
jgi:3-mercaptopyruvate sulfurtransferase SseA